MLSKPHKIVVMPDRPRATPEMVDEWIAGNEQLIRSAERYVERGQNKTDHPLWVRNRCLPGYYKRRHRWEKVRDRLVDEGKRRRIKERRSYHTECESLLDSCPSSSVSPATA